MMADKTVSVDHRDTFQRGPSKLILQHIDQEHFNKHMLKIFGTSSATKIGRGEHIVRINSGKKDLSHIQHLHEIIKRNDHLVDKI